MGFGSVFALADDLSGAAEVAAVLMSAGRSARIALSGPPYGSDPVLVVDLDTRHHPRAGEIVGEAVRHAGGRRVFIKIDSLLRGNVAATVGAVPAPVVLTPALPSAGRVVVGGVPSVDGRPLRETRAWASCPDACPATVAAALGGAPSLLIPLAVVRGGVETLALALAEAAEAGRVAVCDAETDADLDAIVAATDQGACLIGAGGLAAALGRSLDTAGSAAVDSLSLSDRPVLVVVGTAEPGAVEQVRALVEHGARQVTLDLSPTQNGRDVLAQNGQDVFARTARDAAARRIQDALTAGHLTVVTIAPTRAGAESSTLTTRLAETIRQALTPAGDLNHDFDLVLTGGETARRVLDALDVRELTPVTQIHHGAVHSRTPRGTSVVTRPGSFGDRDSLLRIATHLRPDLVLMKG
ncbi:four-carbon acid sugar kinase family protein [Nonomuraea sp. NPDC046802]|uniref:four-carbon acid sugar kinase family protein n=1 Tax=Nonomuraea sp. NPDC046802 TaxID=3154919 RepID=UPI0033C07088